MNPDRCRAELLAGLDVGGLPGLDHDRPGLNHVDEVLLDNRGYQRVFRLLGAGSDADGWGAKRVSNHNTVEVVNRPEPQLA